MATSSQLVLHHHDSILCYRKEPATVEMLEAIVDDAEKSGSLSDLQLATACLLGFAGFMCAAEVLELRPCDCVMSEGMMKVHITGSKTDQLRQGCWPGLSRVHVQ